MSCIAAAAPPVGGGRRCNTTRYVYIGMAAAFSGWVGRAGKRLSLACIPCENGDGVHPTKEARTKPAREASRPAQAGGTEAGGYRPRRNGVPARGRADEEHKGEAGGRAGGAVTVCADSPRTILAVLASLRGGTVGSNAGSLPWQISGICIREVMPELAVVCPCVGLYLRYFFLRGGGGCDAV